MRSNHLALSFYALVVLLAIAGVLQLFLIVVSENTVAGAVEGALGASQATQPDDLQSQPDAFQAPSDRDAEQSRAAGASDAARSSDTQLDSERQAALSFAQSSAIILDGVEMGLQQALELVKGAGDYTSQVDYVSQYRTVPSGCEIVALSVAMRAEGYDVSPEEIADDYLVIGGDVATEYLGSPYDLGGGLPPCIADAANAWLDDHGNGAKAYDLTGTPFKDLLDLVEMGYPVLVWTTEGFVEPTVDLSGDEDGLQWYEPEHCVVLYGLDGGELLVSDSLSGLIRRDYSRFSSIYEECGNMALVVVPEGR